MTRARILCLAAACLLLSAGRGALAQDIYKRVDTEDLARNPRRYFALPILYRDTLLSVPSSSRIRLDRQSYHPFSVRILGTCYATGELAEQMPDLPVGGDYFFTGTVLPQGSRFYVIAQSVSPAVDEEAATSDPRAEAKGAGAAALQEALRNIQSVHLAYAKGNQIELCELYDPKSPHYAKAMDLARAELSALEQKEKTDSIEILARYTVGVLADKCLPPAAVTAAVEAASADVEIEPVESPESDGKPDKVIEEEPPPARSWWTRRRERRAAAAAERARREAEVEEEGVTDEAEPPEKTEPAPEPAPEPDTMAPPEPEETTPTNAHAPMPFATEPMPDSASAAQPADVEPARTNLTWRERRALAREKEADLRAKKGQKAELEREEAQRKKEEAQRDAEAKKREARERKQAEREKKEEARRASEAARAAKAAADAGELSPTASFELRATPPAAPDEVEE